MLTPAQFALQIDGPAVDREVSRLSDKGGAWVQAASVLSRRVNCTLDWEPLGAEGARYRIVASRGEAVLFWDTHTKNRILKLRGLEENGFGSAGFGCILGRDRHGMIGYEPGTLEQAIEREALTWREFGFACRYEDVIGAGVGLLLAQDFINGGAPTLAEIRSYMTAHGWESLAKARDVNPTLCNHAWRRGDVYAFDANETNFIKSDADGKVYPIDLIVWKL